MKIALALSVAFASSVLGADYYVDFTGGSDANPGTIASPFKNHPWMVSFSGSTVLSPGDTVHMKRGEIWTFPSTNNAHLLTVAVSGSAGSYITTTAYGFGDQPLIDVTGTNFTYTVYASGKSFIAVNDLHIRGGGYGIYFQKDGSTAPHDWLITSNHIEQVLGNCVMGFDDSYNIVIGDTNAVTTATISSFSNHFHDFGTAGVQLLGCDPVSKLSNFQVFYNYVHSTTAIVCGQNTYGIGFTARPGSTAFPTLAVAKFNRVENVPVWEGLDSHGGSYFYFQNNWLSNCMHGVAIQRATVSGIATTHGDHFYVQDNVIEIPPDNPCITTDNFIQIDGIDGYITNSIVSGNRCYYTSRPTNVISISGIVLEYVDGVTVTTNEIYNSPSVGSSAAILLYDTPGPVANVTITGNRVHDWHYYGVSIAAPLTGPVTINNNLLDTKEPIRITGYDVMANVTIENNTMRTGDTPLVYFEDHGISNTITASIKNNLMTYSGSFAQRYINGPSATATGIYSVNNNSYFNSSISTPWDLPGIAACNLAAWQGAGFDTYTANPVSDPLYVNAGTGDLRLTYLSPDIDSGQSVGATSDLLGNPIYGTPDIGAYEYQPPLTVGVDSIDAAGCARIYKDGKFRNLFATNGTLTSLQVSPAGGWATYSSSQPRPEWMNVTNLSWAVNGTKTWTLYSTNETGLVSVTVGDLGTNYRCSIVQDSLEITNFVSTGSAFTFTYTSDSSPHVFLLTEKPMEISTLSGAKLSGVFIR